MAKGSSCVTPKLHVVTSALQMTKLHSPSECNDSYVAGITRLLLIALLQVNKQNASGSLGFRSALLAEEAEHTQCLRKTVALTTRPDN